MVRDPRTGVRDVIDVVLPVLDEVDALRWVLPRFPAGYRPVVVDNGSTDGSATVAADLGAVVVTEPRRGFGSACYAGLTRTESDVVCFMDCDASMDPRDLPSITVGVLGGAADLVLGARRPERGAWPLHARLANRWLARELRHRTGAPLTDLGPMRAARREQLLALGLRDRRSGWPLEMVLAAAAHGWRLHEVPVPYLCRTGRSKVTGTVTGTVRAVKDMRAQLRAFAVPGSGPPLRSPIQAIPTRSDDDPQS
jgi:glycosyltransferase involved in cell wall biosynthesis